MRVTRITETTQRKMTVNTEELQALLCCGRATAVRIGTEAQARIAIGRRVLWNVARVQEYLDTMAGVEVDAT